MDNSDVLVIGANVIDLVTYIDRMPIEGETILAPDFEMGFGGKGANQAVAAAKLGSKVKIITGVGKDVFGDQTIENLKKQNVDVKGVIRSDHTTGVAPIFVDPTGENRILIVQGANKEVTAKVIEQNMQDILNSKIVVLQQEIPQESNMKAIEIATKNNIPVIYNPAPAIDLGLSSINNVDFFTPNETELSSVSGMPTTTIEEIKAAAKHVHDSGVTNIIVTLGAQGVFWLDEKHEEVIPGEKVNVVDTTGAGDAFNGAFAHYFIQQNDIKEAILSAIHFAAISVTRRGTQKSFPEKSEL